MGVLTGLGALQVAVYDRLAMHLNCTNPDVGRAVGGGNRVGSSGR